MGEVLYLATDAERNRIIVSHMYLAEQGAASFRGSKGIPFEELVAEGRAALVVAARRPGILDFPDYAATCIKNALIRFIKGWQVFEALDPIDPDEAIDRHFYEWKIYPDLALGEDWVRLDATPEDLTIAFEELSSRSEALSAALRFLSKRERSIIHARFFRQPAQTLDSIARDNKISYAATVRLINRTLKRLKDTVNAREAATPSAVRGS